MNFYLPLEIISIYIGFQECRTIKTIFTSTVKLRSTLYLQFIIPYEGAPFFKKDKVVFLFKSVCNLFHDTAPPHLTLFFIK